MTGIIFHHVLVFSFLCVSLINENPCVYEFLTLNNILYLIHSFAGEDIALNIALIHVIWLSF